MNSVPRFFCGAQAEMDSLMGGFYPRKVDASSAWSPIAHHKAELEGGVADAVRRHLKDFEEMHRQGDCFEFARLLIRGLNLIVEELFGEEDMAPDLVITPNMHRDEGFEDRI